MAKMNTVVSFFFFAILIFFAGGGAMLNQVEGRTCNERWKHGCVIETDCQEKCWRDHGKNAIPGCEILINWCDCTWEC
ncbi:hypothetical protein MKW94_017120 [Papaver nudicaule]|uniref:Uncharacterized protein n=1 Tax=Papaver nudicaule TaxID=74823 RepID=A0AA41VX72_PAPNU|nr:hypothetical protein [Papaver nudicaule]